MGHSRLGRGSCVPIVRFDPKSDLLSRAREITRMADIGPMCTFVDEARAEAQTGDRCHPSRNDVAGASGHRAGAASSGRAQVGGLVAADMADYSRLMGLDEVGTARTLREHATSPMH